MGEKTNCHFDNKPPKKFVIYKESVIDQIGRTFFKIPNDKIVIASLTPCQDSNFINIIDIVPQDFPPDIYFYAIPDNDKNDFIRSVTVKDMCNDGKEYKFKFSIHDTIKTLNARFKHQSSNENINFVYLIDNAELTASTQFSAFPEYHIKINAVMKVAYIDVKQNGSTIFEIGVGLALLKKNTARQLLENTIAKSLERDPQQFKNYEVYYEVSYGKVPQNNTLQVKAQDRITLHLINKEKKHENSVRVQVVLENGVSKKLDIPRESIEHKVPKEIASFVVDQSELYKKQLQAEVDNYKSLGPTEFFKNGQTITIKVTSPNSHEPSTYSLTSPALPSNIQSPEFNEFKAELKRLLEFPDSQSNDKTIKKLIANFMVSQLSK